MNKYGIMISLWPCGNPIGDHWHFSVSGISGIHKGVRDTLEEASEEAKKLCESMLKEAVISEQAKLN